MAKTSEPKLGLAVMCVLAARPNGEALIRTLIRYVPDYVNLTAEDHETSDSRPPEEKWEQRVRNLKSHDTAAGNVIGEGYVARVGHGRYRLTEAGWSRLKQKGLIQE